MQAEASVAGIGILLVFLLISAVCFAVWLWALISACTNKRLEDGGRVMWILLVVFLGIIGAVVYLVAVPRGPAPRKRGRGGAREGRSARGEEERGRGSRATGRVGRNTRGHRRRA
ncbi:MAG: PLD nuclease N-terminal domain-containing protein [Planctomycetota bacterium]|nr:PLD nuclease N-terminal domain-containing protein [Planctomycetota bacterium]